MRHNWDPNDQQNWERNCEAERISQKSKPLRDIDGEVLNPGDLVWLYDHRPVELAIVLGESHRENALVRLVKGGYDFTVSDIDCEKVKPGQYICDKGYLAMKKNQAIL
tara:strand:+ start:907 stop:1230 length:324 start_codon:yes stop_codon:yes gene_type:complete